MLAPGTRLGPYEVLSQIGAGGMGEVYRASDTRLDRLVALKVGAERFSERFEREARTIAALSHPHICTLYDVGPNSLVMELVDGQPLAGPLPLTSALTMAAQMLAALDAAHRKGITHRDLKPANILVTAQGVKLLDFGLAKLASATPAVMGSDPSPLTAAAPTMGALTGEHVIVGTVQYMSPEQAQGKPVDARSDIFSFGLVLYEMLSGRRAFDGTNPTSVIAAILERDPPSLRGTVPAGVERVIERCLAKDPEERWQSARDVRHALELAAHADVPRAQPGLRKLAVAGIAGFAAASLLGAAFWARPGAATDRQALSVQLTPPPDTEFQFSPIGGGSVISPDGRSVAFVPVRDGVPRLWVRRSIR